jgi:hypothetical protein
VDLLEAHPRSLEISTAGPASNDINSRLLHRKNAPLAQIFHFAVPPLHLEPTLDPVPLLDVRIHLNLTAHHGRQVLAAPELPHFGPFDQDDGIVGPVERIRLGTPQSQSDLQNRLYRLEDNCGGIITAVLDWSTRNTSRFFSSRLVDLDVKVCMSDASLQMPITSTNAPTSMLATESMGTKLYLTWGTTPSSFRHSSITLSLFRVISYSFFMVLNCLLAGLT